MGAQRNSKGKIIQAFVSYENPNYIGSTNVPYSYSYYYKTGFFKKEKFLDILKSTLVNLLRLLAKSAIELIPPTTPTPVHLQIKDGVYGKEFYKGHIDIIS